MLVDDAHVILEIVVLVEFEIARSWIGDVDEGAV